MGYSPPKVRPCALTRLPLAPALRRPPGRDLPPPAHREAQGRPLATRLCYDARPAPRRADAWAAAWLMETRGAIADRDRTRRPARRAAPMRDRLRIRPA